MDKKIILVDEDDSILGFEYKTKSHIEGRMHRAFSIFIYNSNKELLLQKRASSKYHSGGLWTNTCCSHQHHNETLEESIHLRLMEEMGLSCNLTEIFTFSYFAKLDNNMIENELDHVFIGTTDSDPVLNLNEAESFKWINKDDLLEDLDKNPESYTYWFKEVISKVLKYIT